MTLFPEQHTYLLESANHGRIPLGLFRQSLPELSSQLEQDREHPCLRLWGSSTNHDEFEREKIVDAKLLRAVGRIARWPIRECNAYHAGLMHTYGYLLSNLRTRFGYKHERWTNGKIERGLGFRERVFWNPSDTGTLLQNVSYFLAKISGLRGPDAAWVRSSSNDSTPRKLTDICYRDLQQERITESIELENGIPIKLITRFVKFPKPTKETHALLCYSYRMGIDRNERLITCFPISRLSFSQETSAERFGSRQLIRLRFNAWIAGFPRDGIVGSRRYRTTKSQ